MSYCLRFILASFFAFNLCKAWETNSAAFLVDEPNGISFEEQLNYTDTGHYTMAVNLGTPVQREPGLTFVVDTTINTILTTTTLCADCTYKTFNMAESSSLVKVTTEPKEMVLPSGYPTVTGLQVTDQVCIISS